MFSIRILLITLLCLSLDLAHAQEPQCPSFTDVNLNIYQWEEEKFNLSENGLGSFSSENPFPGKRNNAATWTDNKGDLWLYGGVVNYLSSTEACFSDLWKYEVASQSWTFIEMPGQAGGNVNKQPANYTGSGPKHPGSRAYSVSWTDSSGNLWLFGGIGYPLNSTHRSKLSDVWKFDTTTLTWEWIIAPDKPLPADYINNLNTTGSHPYPAARIYTGAADDGAGKLWIFGGEQGSPLNLNDLWSYDTTARAWTFHAYQGIPVWGSATSYRSYYEGANVYPGSRQNPACWVDDAGDFYMFGGKGSNHTYGLFALNDLWKYDVSENKWELKTQPGQIGSGGTFASQPNGVYSGENQVPGAREKMVAKKDSKGNFILFGGSNSDRGYSDLWMYQPSLEKWSFLSQRNQWSETEVLNERESYVGDLIRPGRRISNTGWISKSPDELYIFAGGYNLVWSDLWKLPLDNAALNVSINEGASQVVELPFTGNAATDVLTILSQPENVEVSIVPDSVNLITATASFGFYGQDSMIVKLSGSGECEDQTLKVNFNVAKADPCSAVSDRTVHINTDEGNLVELFVPSEALSYSNYDLIITQAPSRGTVTTNAGGRLRYKVTGVNPGTDTVRYKIKTSECESAEGTLTFQINNEGSSDISEWGLY